MSISSLIFRGFLDRAGSKERCTYFFSIFSKSQGRTPAWVTWTTGVWTLGLRGHGHKIAGPSLQPGKANRTKIMWSQWSRQVPFKSVFEYVHMHARFMHTQPLTRARYRKGRGICTLSSRVLNIISICLSNDYFQFKSLKHLAFHLPPSFAPLPNSAQVMLTADQSLRTSGLEGRQLSS